MSKFDQCFDLTVGEEGGYQNNPNDRGNWTTGVIGQGQNKGTKFGLSAMSYPHLDIINLTKDMVKPIYETDYFNSCSCDKLPGPLAALVFDASVNNGQDRARRWLQQALGVVVDGKIGPVTLASVNAWHGKGSGLLVKYQDIRLWFMSNLAGWKTDRGWSTRLLHVLMASLQVTEG